MGFHIPAGHVPTHLPKVGKHRIWKNIASTFSKERFHFFWFLGRNLPEDFFQVLDFLISFVFFGAKAAAS